MTGNLKPYFKKGRDDQWRVPYELNYCGLCASLRSNHGIQSGLLVNYDIAFMIMGMSHLLGSEVYDTLCPTRFFLEKRPIRKHAAIDTAANMTLIISWLKTVDIITDKKDEDWSIYFLASLANKWLKNKCAKIITQLSEETKEIIQKYYLISKGDDKEFKKVQRSTYELAKCICKETLKNVNCSNEFKSLFPEICGLAGEFAATIDPIIDLKEDIDNLMYNPIVQDSVNNNISIQKAYANHCSIYFEIETKIELQLQKHMEWLNEEFHHHVHHSIHVNRYKISEMSQYVFMIA
jgi:hypothetical protein